MVPLYAARIEDLGPGDFVKVDCAACGHTALLVRGADRLALRAMLAPAFVSRLGLERRVKVLDLKDRVRCRGCGGARASRRVDQMEDVGSMIPVDRIRRRAAKYL